MYASIAVQKLDYTYNVCLYFKKDKQQYIFKCLFVGNEGNRMKGEGLYLDFLVDLNLES